MNDTPQRPQTSPRSESSFETAQAPLTPQEARRLELKTERDARRQAEVGRTVRGGGGGG